MPAIMDDPSSPTIYRVSGAAPFPEPGRAGFPPSIRPRQVTLRDRQTIATVIPFASSSQVPPSLLKYLSDQFAKEIEGGDTYPMIEPMSLDQYSKYWFQNFAAIMLLGTVDGPEQVVEGKDWSKECLGSFYIKPNYPGRSSHVCNAGFLVTDAARNRGVGRQMGESYLDWAPRLGYTYSVFNLVYETNVASCKIWDGLGFKRIGRVKGCGNLKSYPDRLVDAIIYGRDLGEAAGDGADGPVSEERFDKIKFYLKYGKYPDGSDRAEKSRLRSAATHYKLLENDVLMLKDKEVISDPVRQMDIARQIHEAGSHSGINKTTATIAERYHWSRIKETVSDVIRICSECKELGKVPLPSNTRKPLANSPGPSQPAESTVLSSDSGPQSQAIEDGDRVLNLKATSRPLPPTTVDLHIRQYDHQSDLASLLNPEPLPPHQLLLHEPLPQLTHEHRQMLDGTSNMSVIPYDPANLFAQIDPRIIAQSGHQDTNDHFDAFRELTHHHSPHATNEQYDVHMHPHHHPPSDEQDTYLKLQTLLNDDSDHLQHGLDPRTVARHANAALVHVSDHDHDHDQDQDQDAVDRDIDMLLEHHDDSDLVDLDGPVTGDTSHGRIGRNAQVDFGSEKRERRNTTMDGDRSPKRRNWDHVIFDAS